MARSYVGATMIPRDEEESFGQVRHVGAGRRAIAVGIVTACFLYTTACLLTRSYGEAFFATPAFVGFVVGLCSRERPYANTCVVLGSTLGLSILALREGVVCVLFSLPLLLPLALCGAFAGFTARRWRNQRRRQRLGIGAILLALGWQTHAGLSDDPSRHPLHVATSSVDVNASPRAVFEQLTARKLAVGGPWPWFLEVGLPIPKSLEVTRPGLGGRIELEQSTGTARGHITRWEPAKSFAYGIHDYQAHDLLFHITRLGRAPTYGLRAERIDDWLTIEGIDFELESLPKGHTRLTRSMSWRRHLAPAFYFGWLQQAIVERGQERLLGSIAEGFGPSSAPPSTAAAGAYVANSTRPSN